jgi:hypothetical protein
MMLLLAALAGCSWLLVCGGAIRHAHAAAASAAAAGAPHRPGTRYQ